MALSDVFTGINNLLKDTTEFAKGVMGSVSEIKGVFDSKKSTTTAPQPANVQNLKPSDFAFTPNWTLLAGGAALLIVALVLARK